MVFPPLGALVALLSPFPLIFIFLQRGKQVALVLMTLIFGVLWFLVGQNQALLFMAEYAVMALVLGEMIQARYPGDWCIGASSLISAVVSILLLVALLGNQETTVQDFFEKQIQLIRNKGILHNNIIIDPGIGFGKNLKHNMNLIRNVSIFHSLGFPILMGNSRKRFIKEIAGKNDTKNKIGGTMTSSIYLMMQGVQILRIHDVNELLQGIKVFKEIIKY